MRFYISLCVDDATLTGAVCTSMVFYYECPFILVGENSSIMGSFLYNLIIHPVELLVELVYVFFIKGFSDEGIAIAGVSLMISIAALPLYNMAEKIQRIERDTRIRLQPGIERIRSAFSGDERYMILSTFYRQNQYHPIYALRSSISLLIQVPFFIAAYNFLSHLEALQGVSFFFIRDLGSPDALISIGSLTFNVLPILMTLINIIVGIIYTKGFPTRDKLQLYGMAALFLVLLYNSPAGLVYYWTLNNLFSLGKNLFYKLKSPARVAYFCAAIGSIAGTALIILTNRSITVQKITFVVTICLIVCSIPLWLFLLRKMYELFLLDFSSHDKVRNSLFLFSCLSLWIVNGILLPSNLIGSSPQEFAMVGTVQNPLQFIGMTAVLFFGIWCFWPISIYLLYGKKIKTGFALLFTMMAISSLFNALVFSSEYGVVNPLLIFENPILLKPSMYIVLGSVTSLMIVGVLLLLAISKGKASYFLAFGLITTLAGGIVGLVNIWQINNAFNEYEHVLAKTESSVVEQLEPVFHLSPHGKNVIVLMLDRAINSYFPVIVEEFPKLKSQFQGFTYYPNTVSFGSGTLTGAPALMGGYEYTPRRMNERSTERLVDKHNESMLVLPRIFSEAGFTATVTDPPFSNYAWSGDLRPFDAYPEIRALNLHGAYTLRYKRDHTDDFSKSEDIVTTIESRLPVFSLMQSSLPVLREILYDSGNYLSAKNITDNSDEFLASYAQLFYLDELTDYSATGNTYHFIDNQSTHEPVNLQYPSWKPVSVVSDVYRPFEDVASLDERDIGTYHVNVASLLRIGLWLEQLQKDGVYDNTRIIIVADHGRDVYTPGFSGFTNNARVYGDYHPLFLYKDFKQRGDVQEDMSFMTNADAAILAIRDLPVSTKNPFTGNDLLEKIDKDTVEVFKGPWAANPRLGNTFTFNYSRSFTVKDNIFVESNWSLIPQP